METEKKGGLVRNEKGNISSTKILSVFSGGSGIALALLAGGFAVVTGAAVPAGIAVLVGMLLAGTGIRPLAAGVRGLTAKNGN